MRKPAIYLIERPCTKNGGRTHTKGRFEMRQMVLHSLCVLIVCSCTIRIGPLDEDQTGPPSLPDPGGASSGTLNETQQARQQEVDRYIAEVIYQGGHVVNSALLPSGDIIDFLDRNTLPALPNALPGLPFGPEALVLPNSLNFGLSELQQSAELLGLAATTVPFHRPAFRPYIMGETPDASSVEDYLARYQEGGEPTGVRRLYAGLVSMEPNRGISGYMSQFKPEVSDKSFSLLEFTVSCPADGPRQELIGIAISVDKKNKFGPLKQEYQDGEARLHIEYAHMVNGKASYVWDGMDGHFVPNPFRLHHPGQIVPVSELNKTSIEHLLTIFQVPTGDYWLAYNGDLLGYYPASLFTMLKGQACRAAWYGEVYRRDVTLGAIPTEMGSGQFAEAGLFHAAHFRNPRYYDLDWFGVEPKDGLSMTPMQPLCYNKSALTFLPAPWESRFIFLGGPGGKNPGCKWP